MAPHRLLRLLEKGRHCYWHRPDGASPGSCTTRAARASREVAIGEDLRSDQRPSIPYGQDPGIHGFDPHTCHARVHFSLAEFLKGQRANQSPWLGQGWEKPRPSASTSAFPIQKPRGGREGQAAAVKALVAGKAGAAGGRRGCEDETDGRHAPGMHARSGRTKTSSHLYTQMRARARARALTHTHTRIRDREPGSSWSSAWQHSTRQTQS